MAQLIEKLIEEAKKDPKRVALPECEAENTLLAARKLLDEGIGTPVLVNDPAVIKETAEKTGVSTEGMEIVDITDEAARTELVSRYMAAEPRMLSEKSYNRRAKKPLYYALILESVGDVDCTFAGHTSTTGEVLMAAQEVVGLSEGVDVSSLMAIVEVPGFEGPEGDTVVFADCGLNPEPNPEELASIAIATADNAAAILGWDPRVAFLSPRTPSRPWRSPSSAVRTSRSTVSSSLTPPSSPRWPSARSSATPRLPAVPTCSSSPTSTPPTWASRSYSSLPTARALATPSPASAYPSPIPHAAPQSRRFWATSRCWSSPPAVRASSKPL